MTGIHTNLTKTAKNPDRRRAVRERVSISGYVRGTDRGLSIPCRVVDLSSGGARIKIDNSKGRARSAADLPTEVVLTLSYDQVEVIGQIRWNDREEFGMQFATGFRRKGPSPLRDGGSIHG